MVVPPAGLSAKFNSNKTTRQTTGDQSGLKLARSLFAKVVPASHFNGISSGYPSGISPVAAWRKRFAIIPEFKTANGTPPHD